MCGHLCLSVGCCTDKSFVAACSNFAYIDTCNMYKHLYLLVIAMISLHLAAIFIFYIYAYTFITVLETKCFSKMCINVGYICTFQWKYSGKYV